MAVNRFSVNLSLFLTIAFTTGCNGESLNQIAALSLSLSLLKNPAICSSYQFECRSGQCVSNSDRCDGYNDCYDGSDESSLYGCSTSSQFLFCIE